MHKFVACCSPPPRPCWRRSTTVASRCWCCPRRASAAAAKSCSRPGTRSRAGPLRRHLLARTGARARRRRRARRQQDRRELRRAGDLLDAGHRRRRAGPPSPPAPRHRPRAAAQLRGVQDASQRGSRARAARCDRGAAAGPSGGLAPLRADDHPAARGAARAPLDATSAPLDARAPRPVTGSRTTRHRSLELPTDTLRHTAFDAIQRRMGGQFAEWEGWDWISDFGDAVAEHHAVRETVGLWDESPLQKWLFRGPDALAAADYCFTSDMAGARGRPGALRRVLRRARHACSATAPSTTPATTRSGILVVTALSTDGDHFRSASAAKGLDVEVVEVTASCRTCSCRARARASCSPSLTDADIAVAALLPVPRGRDHRRRAGLPGLAHRLLGRAGLRDLHARPRTPSGCGSALLDPGQSLGLRPYGLAAVESLRIESGLIFLGYDYFPAYTSPFHMNLDRMIKLDKADFLGKEALAAEHAAGITHRMVTLVIAGEEAPTTTRRSTATAARSASCSRRQRRPLADRRPPDRHGLHRDRADRGRHARSRSRSRDGRTVPALVDATRSTTRRRRARGPERTCLDLTPVGILAEDADGISVARALQRLLPREDLLLLCDDAYAPYARRRPDVVARRVARPARRAAADGAKILVLASPQGVLDACAAQPAGAVALIALEAPIPQAGRGLRRRRGGGRRDAGQRARRARSARRCGASAARRRSTSRSGRSTTTRPRRARRRR